MENAINPGLSEAAAMPELTQAEVFKLIEGYRIIKDPQLKAEFYHDHPALYQVFSKLNHPSREDVEAKRQIRLMGSSPSPRPSPPGEGEMISATASASSPTPDK